MRFYVVSGDERPHVRQEVALAAQEAAQALELGGLALAVDGVGEREEVLTAQELASRPGGREALWAWEATDDAAVEALCALLEAEDD